MLLQSLKDSLAEAVTDEVPLPRNQPDHILTPMPEETSPMLESTPDLNLPPQDQITPTLDNTIHKDDSIAGEPTLVPQKSRQERPSIGDWMGTWWARGRSRERSSHNDDKDSPTDESSNESTPKAHKRKATKNVFNSLGISILNSGSPSLSSQRSSIVTTTASDVTNASDTASIKSGHTNIASSTTTAVSVVSSPAYLPSPAAPLVTMLDGLTSPQTTYDATKASSVAEDSHPVLIQGATLRAIANATRVMTSDPGSILADQGRDTGPLVAKLAMELIKNARDEAIMFHERPKDRKDTKHDCSPDLAEKSGPTVTLSPGIGSADAATSLNRALAGQAENVRKSNKSRSATIMQSKKSPPFPIPSPFGTFMAQQQPRKPSNMGDKNPGGQGHDTSASPIPSATATNTTSPNRKIAFVPLESIIPAKAKPPTQYLSRTYTPLTSRDFRFTIPLPQSASKYTIYHDDKNQRPLTDRYGFMYDVSQYDVLLLIRAKECGNTAPACLTGVKIADREEDNSWPDDEDVDGTPVKDTISIVKESCTCNGEPESRSIKSPMLASAGFSLDANSISDSHSVNNKSRSSSQSRKRSSTVTSTAIPPSIAGSTTSILSVNSDTPRHACANTVRRLLNQLTEIHDQQQASQRKEWDSFVKQRSKVKLLKGNVAGGTLSSIAAGAGVGGTAAAILGLGTACEDDELSHSEGLIGFAQLGLSSNRDERREFDRLVRHGIPLVYRSKVWMECSGALDMREPGLFQDLLAQVDGPDSVISEIEKDVGRTMPLNIFYGGDGAGVSKLRRVLIAYSR